MEHRIILLVTITFLCHTVAKKGNCLKCEEDGYTPPPSEIEHIDMQEIIQFLMFVSLSCCAVPSHSRFHLEKFDKKPIVCCIWCEDMTNKHPR